jgi:hypothetical protein
MDLRVDLVAVTKKKETLLRLSPESNLDRPSRSPVTILTELPRFRPLLKEPATTRVPCLHLCYNDVTD